MFRDASVKRLVSAEQLHSTASQMGNDHNRRSTIQCARA